MHPLDIWAHTGGILTTSWSAAKAWVAPLVAQQVGPVGPATGPWWLPLATMIVYGLVILGGKYIDRRYPKKS